MLYQIADICKVDHYSTMVSEMFELSIEMNLFSEISMLLLTILQVIDSDGVV